MLLESRCPDLKLLSRGKVRDVYEVDARHLLFVATDRISAFDVVMATGIPDKGRILTAMSLWWFDLLGYLGPHHLVTADVASMPAKVRPYADQLAGRCMLVRKLRIQPIEAIVRGHLAGSGWTEYRRSGTVCGIPLPPGLRESDRLPAPLYTPSTKAALGSHDENISPQRARELLGDSSIADSIAARAVELYSAAREYAAARGVIIADTKFEFGIDEDGRLVLADEVLTPDSSRFWPADSWVPGSTPPSFDKQYLRDWLESIHFDKRTPLALPEEVARGTRERYLEAWRLLTGGQTLDL